MKQKNLVIIVILAVVLLGIWALTQNGDSSKKTSTAARNVGDKLLRDFPVNDISKITLTDGDGSATLVRQGQDWVVSERSNYTASFQDISAALTKLWNLKVAQEIRATEATLERLQLGDPADEQAVAPATRVTFYGSDDQELATLYLGEEHVETLAGAPDGRGLPNGRFVAVGDERDHVYVVMDTLNRLEANPVSWLDDRFFKISEILSVKVDRPSDAEGADWSATREDARADFSLGDAGEGEELDETKMQALKRLLVSPSFSDVVSKDDANMEELFAESTSATITTAQGFTYNVEVGQQNADGEYALQMSVEADLPEPTTEEQAETGADADESVEEGAQPEEGNAVATRLKEKLAQEQLLQEWVFYVPGFVVQPLTQDRQELLKQEEDGDAAAQGQAPDLPGMPGTVQSEREVPGGKIQRVKVPLPGFDGDGAQVDPEGQPSISVRPTEVQEQQPEAVDQAEPADEEGSTPKSEDADAAGNEQTGD